MGFRINTNVAALNAHNSAVLNNRNLDSSLAKLSSGLRINKAADDASGMAIADSLRSQANSLGQAVANANDAIGLIQTADKAMDEQVKILDTIKTKAIQAASDGQTTSSREAIQKDVNRLLEQLDNIAKTTSFNGQVLLSGNFTNKEFQIGAYSNQTISASIKNTQALAIGNITSMTDTAAVGNTSSVTATLEITKGSKFISLSAAGLDPQGLATGDTIRIKGVGDYVIKNIQGSMSTGSMSSAVIELDRGIGKTISVGATLKISLVNTVAENLSSLSAFAIGTAAGTVSVNSSDVTGFAVGDKFSLTTSLGETKTFVVTTITGSSSGVTSGSITFSSTGTVGTVGSLSNGQISVNDRASLGTDFTADDFVQYTVEGTTLQGVQLTEKITIKNSDNVDKTYAKGVAQSGLGRVADLINSTTDKTGIKAVAVVEQNSSIRVLAGSITSDIVINGVRILDKGASILASDNDNILVSNINAKTSVTGVSAAIEADGSLTLTSDGRAIVTDGLSGIAGINDGVHAGKLVLTNTKGGAIDVASKHFEDAGLVKTNSSADTLNEVTKSNTLSDLVYGQIDDNNDGMINSKDKTGLMMTTKGAMLAMDIAESAISTLDSVRADLGATQNQLTVTVNNISVTQVNVKAAESNIRDVDFAAESANFSKFNILAQSGSYAMSQANAVQQNVLRLLQ